MPKETFLNLPEEKREHITNIAIDEFANNDFAEVSISRIVARAGIAKGSFYQYFEDKEDLYSYLLDLAMRAKWETLSLDHPDPQHIGIFAYLMWTLQGSAQMQIKYPNLVKVAFRALNRNAYPEDFMARAQEESHKFFMKLVKLGKEQGDISPEIDDDLAAFIFNTVTVNLGHFLLPHITAAQNSPPGEEFFFMTEVSRLYQQVLNIFEHGMGKSYPHDPTNGDVKVVKAEKVENERK